MTTSQESAFDAAMRDIYATAVRECDYYPTYFLQMVQDRGGLAAARTLLSKPPSAGFTRLWELGRLDLTVEDLVLRPEWEGLFDDALLATARRRLQR